MNYLSKMSVLLTAFLLFIACSDDNPWVGAEGTGGIRLSLKADANVADAVPQTRATETLTAPDIISPKHTQVPRLLPPSPTNTTKELRNSTSLTLRSQIW